MNLSDLPRLLADSAVTEREFRIGEILAGSCVMAALTGSLCILAFWWNRYSRGTSVMPAASRPLLQITAPLLISGLLMALMMAGLALAVSSTDINPDRQTSTALTDSIKSDRGQPPVSDTDSSGLRLPDDRRTQQSIPTTSLTGDSTAADRPDSPNLAKKLRQAVIYDIVLILLLGIPVLLLNWRQLPFLNSPETSQHNDEAQTGQTQTVDDQNLSLVHLNVTGPSSLVSDDDISRNETPAEEWQWKPELQFATEICLVAWLPTALLKLTLALLLPAQDQHPFLEMIMNGVSTESLLLIAVTAVVLAPLMEELLYRVVILGGFLNHRSPFRLPVPLAICVTSLLFAFAHGFPDSIALLPLAAAIGWTYCQRRSYRTVVLVHVLFNGFNIAVAGLTML
ncbi:MAG: CPBP family intramembrane metalloprotease [Fuerstiella sp.]|nr:CPBP family intramembrane metalloprotease [Fuerstiella sp.]